MSPAGWRGEKEKVANFCYMLMKAQNKN